MRATLPLAALLAFAVTPLAAQSPHLSAGGMIGYQDGIAFQAFGTVQDLAQGLPMAFRFRLGRVAMDPGSPAQARRVFINNATNGTPVSSGRTWDAGFDFVFPRGPNTRYYAGVRRTSFKANFKFIGGNEDFDVTSSQWGLAAGLERSYRMTRKMDLVLAGGAEWYRKATLKGHDTSYSPGGEAVNPREDYTYSDADKAVSQPKLRPSLMLGVTYRLGNW